MNVAELYPIEWYRERLAERGGPHDSNIRLAEIVAEMFAPTSVIDLGAATCAFANRMGQLGVRVTAVDHLPQCFEFATDCSFIAHDLRTPLVFGEKFDLVTCWETIEHLPPEAEDAIVETIVRLARRWAVLSISSSTAGYHHVNVKPRSHWLEVFDQAGLIYDPASTQRLANRIQEDPLVPCKWFAENLSVWSVA